MKIKNFKLKINQLINNPFLKTYNIEILIVIFSLIFSFWLMYSSFSYANGNMLISAKSWSDFASHIPLIRSFSFGNNFPPEYPIFPGEPIRYHFLFYLLVGLLEKTGVRIDIALNSLSAISFTLLIFSIYFFAKTLFKNIIIGVLSVVFFLFNGSLSFLEFFKIHPLSTATFNDILNNSNFPSFGPYDGKIVSAFWNLNIFTNQRHLALPLALLFLIVSVLLIYEEKKERMPKKIIFTIAVFIGLLPFAHSSIFIMAISVLSFLFLLLPDQRKNLFFILLIAVFISLPRVLFLKQTASYNPHLQLGYLITNSLNIFTFFDYWFKNLGLFLILIPFGVLFSTVKQKKIFLAFFTLFLIGNLVQFSPEIAGNHKFFNAFLIIGNMYAAFFLVRYWKKHKFLKAIVFPVIFLLVFSGIIDFFPIKNDGFISLEDYPKNQDIKWIKENTAQDSIFLNSSYLYNPASLAGRGIFLGWPYFAWSLGYDTLKRDNLRKELLNPNNLEYFCSEVKKYHLNYVDIDNTQNDFIVNQYFFEINLPKVYNDNHNGFIIYATKPACKNFNIHKP
ncbi:MAG: hypothetical protein Q8P10_03555 [bacterium]|nr:hypothetical protein [bacterium]